MKQRIEINNATNGKHIHVIPYSHADFAWTHYRQWHIERYILIINEVLEAMDKNPGFTWMTDNISHMLMPFFENCPSKIEEFIKRVKEGRLEITNGIISLIRPTQVGGEVFIRNIVFGKRFLKDLIEGYDTDVYHSVDVAIGHSQMPQLLKLGGYKYYRAWRPQGALDYKGFPKEFDWIGKDGSSIICSRGTYAGLCRIDYLNSDFDTDWDNIVNEFYHKELKGRMFNSEIDNLWLSFGTDDTRPLLDYNDEPCRILDFIEEWNNKEQSSISLSTAKTYFESIDKSSLSVVKCVLDGCDVGYNTPTKGESGLWNIRMFLEHALLKTETICTFASMFGMEYPEVDLKNSWDALLRLSGHAMEFVLDSDYDSLLNEAAFTKYKLKAALDAAMKSIANKLDGDKQFVVFNTLNWEREEIIPVLVSFPQGGKSFNIVDTKGNILEYQICKTLTGGIPYKGAKFDEADVLVKVKIPPMGFTTFKVVEKNKNLEKQDFGMEFEDVDLKIDGDGSQTINTGKVKVEFKAGKIISVIDDDEIVYQAQNQEASLNDIRFTHVNHHEKGAWLFFSDYQGIDYFIPSNWAFEEYGPLRWKYVVYGNIGIQKVKQEIVLYKDSESIDFSVELECIKPQTGFFSAVFPIDKNESIVAGIPFGFEEKNIESEPYGKLTECAIDNIERNWKGLFYANDWVSYNYKERRNCIIGESIGQYFVHDPLENSISIILTRCFDLNKSKDWVKYIHKSSELIGRNNFKYSYQLGKRYNSNINFIKKAKEKKNKPDVVVKLGYDSPRSLSNINTIFNVEGESIIVSACYMDSGKTIIRIYEAEGKSCEARITLAKEYSTAFVSDFFGNNVYDSRLQETKNGICIKLNSFEIVTLCFE